MKDFEGKSRQKSQNYFYEEASKQNHQNLHILNSPSWLMFYVLDLSFILYNFLNNQIESKLQT